jgi:hypothetical protein
LNIDDRLLTGATFIGAKRELNSLKSQVILIKA